MSAPCCLGGWCDRREQCKHYQAQDRRYPIERLCEPKQHDAFERRVVPIVQRAQEAA